jgi:hypothetical protein
MQIIKNKLTKIPNLPILLAGILTLITLSFPAPVSAASACQNPNATHAQLKTAKCCDTNSPNSTTLNNCIRGNGIFKDISAIIDVLAAGVGIVVTGSIIWGGVQYTMAGNNANTVSAAKKRIFDSLVALFIFFFMFAFLEWIVPGGIIG